MACCCGGGTIPIEYSLAVMLAAAETCLSMLSKLTVTRLLGALAACSCTPTLLEWPIRLSLDLVKAIRALVSLDKISHECKQLIKA